MAGATIVITVDDKDLKAKLAKLESAVADMGEAFGDIGEYLLRSHRDRFERQTSPEGVRWEPLSQDYLEHKPKNKDKILVLDGHLSGELHYQIGEKELLFGTDSKYGATHQFGREQDGIPARPFLGVSSEDEKEIAEIVGDYLRDAL